LPYDNLTSRTDVAALIPEDVSNAMLTNLQALSAARALFTNIILPRNQTRFPVLSALPVAYFVNGDTGLKQTTEMSWANRYINVEELAAIAPMPDNVVADSDTDLWGIMQSGIESAIARALDAAIFFGVNKPASWPNAIVTDAVAAGNTINRGTNADGAAGGIAEDINDLMAAVEADGYDVNGFVADRVFRARLRGARDSTGQRLLDINGNVDNVEGVPMTYAMAGQWPSGTGSAELIAGDFRQGILGIRQDISVTMANQAVIQDSNGATVYNLFQQDMQAMRITFRVGYAVSNPINYSQPTEGSRYPFGVLRTP
jgi:HK97 family phage major capsid protein